MRGVICLVLLLSACGQEPKSADSVETTSKAPIAVEPTGWTTIGIGPEAERIGYSDGTGGMAMELSCLPGPARLHVTVAGLSRIDSEERLTLGVGERLIVMVAVPRAGIPVAAEVPLSPELIATLGSGGDIALSYGQSHFGPVMAPPDTLMDGFSTACTAALTEGAAEAERDDL